MSGVTLAAVFGGAVYLRRRYNEQVLEEGRERMRDSIYNPNYRPDATQDDNTTEREQEEEEEDRVVAHFTPDMTSDGEVIYYLSAIILLP